MSQVKFPTELLSAKTITGRKLQITITEAVYERCTLHVATDDARVWWCLKTKELQGFVDALQAYLTLQKMKNRGSMVG